MQKLILMTMLYLNIRILVELRDLNEEEPIEIEASKHDLAYIKLDGSIGCMVNGAGLSYGHYGYN